MSRQRFEEQVRALEIRWLTEDRWAGITRPYTAADVVRLRGSVRVEQPAYVRLQEREFELEPEGYTATRHPREVGAGYFDEVLMAVTGGAASTGALQGSTKQAQFTARR